MLPVVQITRAVVITGVPILVEEFLLIFFPDTPGVICEVFAWQLERVGVGTGDNCRQIIFQTANVYRHRLQIAIGGGDCGFGCQGSFSREFILLLSLWKLHFSLILWLFAKGEGGGENQRRSNANSA